MNSFSSHIQFPCILWLCLISVISCSSEERFDFDEHERIAYVGNALGERMQYDGWLETYLQASHPGHELVFRNLAVSGDRVDHRPRSCGGRSDQPDADYECSDYAFWHPDSLLAEVNPDVIFSFFGYNESFDDDPDKFRNQLIEWIDHARSRPDGGEDAPRIVLFSPIAHEDLATHNLPDGTENNRRLEMYTNVMAEVARRDDVRFVDLFTATRELYDRSSSPLTINGIHLSQEGNRQVAQLITENLLGLVPRVEEGHLASIREAVLDKNWHWFNRYRATSGNDIWGSRKDWHNNYQALQHELHMLDVMTANRDQHIWTWSERMAAPDAEGTGELGGMMEVDDSNVPEPLEVEEEMVPPYSSEFRPADATPGEGTEYLDGEDAISEMQVAEGLSVHLFADEKMFPELINPVQMQVDTKGRIWVAVWATYPKWEPLKEMNDRILILEDTTGDGKADKSTVFAEIHNPTGFEFWNGGVIVASAPNMWYLRDTTGDDKADVRIPMLTGFDDAMDTHHTANNFVYGPDGYIYYGRGIFHLSNVETPWREPVESGLPAIFRFNPRTFEFDQFVEISPNPHGISFDRWGDQYITDGTTGSAFQVYLDEEGQFDKRQLLNHSVRPVTGNNVLSSGHLPEEFENNFLISNVIAYRGFKRYALNYKDGIVEGEERSDLLYSRDPNFRPTDSVVGDDGAVYISDWHNPHIAHSIPNMRSELRDHAHGRIYRITADGRPLQEPVAIDGEPIVQLLDLLQHPVNSIRHRVRIELSGRETDEVITALQGWIQQFDSASSEDAHPLLEALWVHQQHNRVNQELLDRMLESPEERARIAARRVAHDWSGRQPDVTAISHHNASITDADSAEEKMESELDLTDSDIAELTIKAVPHMLRFDIDRFTVRSGQSVILIFENPDYMPHNLLIVNPGMADEVAEEAINLDAEGFAKAFIPDNANILFATDLLGYNEMEIMEFRAPEEPGDYPFVCTFPGHAAQMRGVMRVQ